MIFSLKAWWLPNSSTLAKILMMPSVQSQWPPYFFGHLWFQKGDVERSAHGYIKSYLELPNLENWAVLTPSKCSEQFCINQLPAEVLWLLRFKWSWFWTHSRASGNTTSLSLSRNSGWGGLYSAAAFSFKSLLSWHNSVYRRHCCCTCTVPHLNCRTQPFSLLYHLFPAPHSKVLMWYWLY